jgi:hypothetical protein
LIEEKKIIKTKEPSSIKQKKIPNETEIRHRACWKTPKLVCAIIKLCFERGKSERRTNKKYEYYEEMQYI